MRIAVNHTLLFGMVSALGVLGTAASLQAQSDAAEDLKKAARTLAGRESYGWSAASKSEDQEDPENQFRMGPIEGATGKDGFTSLKTKVVYEGTERTLEGAWRSGQRIFKTDRFDWSPVGWESKYGGGTETFHLRFLISHVVRNYRNPAADVEALIEEVKGLKAEGGGIYSAELTEKAVLDLCWRGPGYEMESNAKGTVRFWVKDGVLAKYEFSLQGKRAYGKVTVNRTTTIEIKDVNATKVTIPEDARKKLE